MSTYYMEQKISIKDKYNIYDSDNKPVFQIEGDKKTVALDRLFGNIFSIGHTLRIVNLSGGVEITLRRKPGIIFKKYEVVDNNGVVISVISQSKNIFVPKLKVEDKDYKYLISGDIMAKKFTISRNGAEVASVRKKLITVKDMYVVDIHVEKYEKLILAMILAIDNCYHN